MAFSADKPGFSVDAMDDMLDPHQSDGASLQLSVTYRCRRRESLLAVPALIAMGG